MAGVFGDISLFEFRLDTRGCNRVPPISTIHRTTRRTVQKRRDAVHRTRTRIEDTPCVNLEHSPPRDGADTAGAADATGMLGFSDRRTHPHA